LPGFGGGFFRERNNLKILDGMRLAVPVLELLLDEIAVSFAAVGTNVEKVRRERWPPNLFEVVIKVAPLPISSRDEEVALIERSCDIFGFVGDEISSMAKRSAFSNFHRGIGLDDGVGDEDAAVGTIRNVGEWNDVLQD